MSPKLPVVTSRQLIRALKKAGFVIHRQKGSHIHMKHEEPPMIVISVPYHNVDIKKGTLRRILKDAKLSVNQFRELI
ncbi:type II toxin-antitoxin system HicA family toxin [bacterium]|nr:type II toxin-antitoxin system HicA family toxin [FCB group bacterium]MBL7191810.1 type II toxin-antitoxin system HicA family toxin [bacterium]